jgi:hypothetical protein
MRNNLASHRSRTSARSNRTTASRQYAVETLETRRLLSTFNWTNRNITSDTDSRDNRFDNVFGTKANQAIAVIDAAIAMWQRTIAGFNYGNGTDTYNLTVTMNPADAAGASSTAGSANGGFVGSQNINGKPAVGWMGLGWTSGIAAGTNTAAGWYLDPTPTESSEFQGTFFNAFARGPTTGLGGFDLFTAALHELGHAVGLASTTQTQARSADTGTTDGVSAPASTPPSTLWGYGNNGSLWTEWDSGGATGTASNAQGPQHFAPLNTSAIVGGGTRVGAVALMNPTYTTRSIISDLEADCARLAYGYSISRPSDMGTTYAQLDADGTLRVNTTSLSTATANSDDTITITTTGGLTVVQINPTQRVATIDPLGTIQCSFTASAVQRITINSGSGNDTIRIESAAATISVDTGEGDDNIDLSFNNRNLDSITGGTTVVGGNGSDTLWVYDNNTSTAKTFTVTGAQINRAGFGGVFYGASVDFLNLTTGTAADTVNVEGTFANATSSTPVWLWSAGGAETVNVGRTSDGIRGINANLTINNDPALTTLNINNGPDTGARVWNIDAVENYGYLIGMAPANIYWDNSDISSINLTCGSGVDTGQFVISTETFNLNNAGGDDIIRVGVPAAAGTSLLSGQITIDNAPAHTALTIDDNGYSQIRNITVDEAAGYNTVTGFGSGVLIRFDSNDVSSATIVTGSGNDTVTVPRTDETLNIVNFGGLDGVTIGNATNGVQSITSPVSISGPFGPSIVTINNGADTTARTATLQNATISGNTYSEWTGLAPAPIRYRDQITATVTFGTAVDTVLVRQTQQDLNLTSTGGLDLYTIGGASNGAQSVLGNITLTNPTHHNIITIDDAANTVARNATLDDVTISGAPYGRLTGLAPATINWKYNDTTSISITQGAGADSLAVKRHQKPLTIQGTAGADTVTLGGVAGIGMNAIIAATSVYNTSGATTLVLNDSTDTTATSLNTLIHEMNTLLLGRVTGMSPAPVDYRFGQVNNVRLRTSQGGPNNILVIHETSPLTHVFYDPGAAFETLYVNDDSIGSAALYTDRSVHPNTAYIFDGAAIYQQPGNFVFRGGVQIMSNGVLDISDGAMIYDFDEGNPLDGFREKIIQGYNGGDWLGLGIRSSTAASTPGGTVGYANASDLFSSFPATFMGQSVDDTTVLVRYTPAGNANLDRQVNTLDFNLLAANFGDSGKSFSEGDFDYSGEVDSVDFGILVSQYGKTLPTASATAIPSLSPTPSIFGGAPVEASEDDPILKLV